MKTIFLIRHSVPINKNLLLFENEKNSQIINEKIPLSVDGDKLANEMAKKYFDNNIEELWSSTYDRAISTAKYISELNNIKINITSLFNERTLGNEEGVKEEFWLEQLNDQYAKTVDGESRKEVTERMLTGINKVLTKLNEGEQGVIVTHATAITFLLMNWCNLKEAYLKGKRRWLVFNDKDVINDSFHTPEVFKLDFDNNKLIDITRL